MSVIQERVLGGTPTPLKISGRRAGARWAGPQSANAQMGETLGIDRQNGLLVWPQTPLPEGVRGLELSLQVKHLSSLSRIRLELGQGAGLAYLWHPGMNSRQLAVAYSGWLSLSLPMDLSPAPGSKMRMRLEGILGPGGHQGEIIQARRSWVR
jgi:hypothetical protein